MYGGDHPTKAPLPASSPTPVGWTWTARSLEKGGQLFPGHSRGALHIISHDLPAATFSQTFKSMPNKCWKYSEIKLTGRVFSSRNLSSCISCVRPVALMDDRHLSCFSFAAAADDLRSVCLWIMSNHQHTDKEDNLPSRQHKEVWETSKHQRVHKSLWWDEGASAAAAAAGAEAAGGWTTSMCEKLILHPDSSRKEKKMSSMCGSDHQQQIDAGKQELYIQAFHSVSATSWGYLQFTLVMRMMMMTMMMLHTLTTYKHYKKNTDVIYDVFVSLRRKSLLIKTRFRHSY